MLPALPEDRYAVVRPVGVGAHGQVFEATDRTSGERVALKHVRRSRGVSTGLGEFAAVLTVDHPSIVRCLDFHYLNNGDTCLVYEFISGGTLREHMAEGLPAPAEVWELVARHVLAALAHLHQKQILHCDLKPENILCHPLPEGGNRYMLSDLGVARYLQQRPALDYAATPAGAPAYMAPESFYHQYSPASDLYGLGVILFELATGSRPFEGDIRSIARAHLQVSPAVDLIPDPAQREFVAWLLHKETSARPRSATDALRRLDGLAATEEIVRPSAPSPLPSVATFEAYEFVNEFVLHTLSHQHLPLTVCGRPTLAALYDGHLELFDAANGHALNRFLPCLPGTLQLYPDSTLLSAQPRRIVAWENDYRLPRAVLDLDGHPRAALLNRSRTQVIWIEDDRAFIRPLDRQAGALHSIECPASGLRPRLLLAPEQGGAEFILLPGTPRPEALWLDREGKVLGRHLLPGPVVDNSHTCFAAVFCATPSDFSATGLTLVVFGGPGEVALLPFDQLPRFHSFCEDGVVLGDQSGAVSFIGEQGRRRSIGTVDDAGCTLLFAPRREFYLTVNQTGHHRRFQLYRLP